MTKEKTKATVKAKAKTRAKKARPGPSLFQRAMRTIGYVPAPKPKGKKKVAVGPHTRTKPGNNGGNGTKPAGQRKPGSAAATPALPGINSAVQQADNQIAAVLAYAKEHPLDGVSDAQAGVARVDGPPVKP